MGIGNKLMDIADSIIPQLEGLTYKEINEVLNYIKTQTSLSVIPKIITISEELGLV